MGNKFVEWLFDLYTASALNPEIDDYVRREVIAFRRQYSIRLKSKERRVIARLEESPEPAKLLQWALKEADFKL